MKRIYIIVITIVIILSAGSARAESGSYIGVAKTTYEDQDKTNLKLFDFNGNLVGTTKIKDSYLASMSIKSDISSQDGLEWIYYNNGKIIIKNQGNDSEIYSFDALSDRYDAIKAVGDLFPEYPGEEIVVCHRSALLPKVKIFSYSDEDGATKIKSFKPFGERGSITRGCDGISIGDVDGDSVNELLINKGANTIKIFSKDGELIEKFSKSFPTYMRLLNIDNEGGEELISTSDEYIYIYSKKNDDLVTIYWKDIAQGANNMKRLRVGDVDGDGKDEIIILQKGRKAKVYIINGDGEVESEFKAFPDQEYKKNYDLFVGNFSY